MFGEIRTVKEQDPLGLENFNCDLDVTFSQFNNSHVSQISNCVLPVLDNLFQMSIT